MLENFIARQSKYTDVDMYGDPVPENYPVLVPLEMAYPVCSVLSLYQNRDGSVKLATNEYGKLALDYIIYDTDSPTYTPAYYDGNDCGWIRRTNRNGVYYLKWKIDEKGRVRVDKKIYKQMERQ